MIFIKAVISSTNGVTVGWSTITYPYLASYFDIPLTENDT